MTSHHRKLCQWLSCAALALLAATACADAERGSDHSASDSVAGRGAATPRGMAPSSTRPATSTADSTADRLDAFTRGAAPPQLSVQARAVRAGTGGPTIAFGGTMKDSSMIAVAQFRLARQAESGSDGASGNAWSPATTWMALILGGGRWNEATGEFTGSAMQHMRFTPGTYRVIVRATDSRSSTAQAVSQPVVIR